MTLPRSGGAPECVSLIGNPDARVAGLRACW
jgi:hypothetical protein